MQKNVRKRRNRKKKKKNLLLEFIVITVSIVAVFFILAFAVFMFTIGGLNKENLSTENLSVNEISDEYKDMKIKNIALFGTDSRENIDGGRSDAIIIASVNPKNGEIKLISIARDTYVDIPDHGQTKINHAYSYGGAELAVKTLNSNFGLDITDFVSVNFDQLTEIVDILGGVDVEITESERQEFNRIIAETTNETLSESGMVHLNGAQTLCYSRIRKSDSDDARTERQREVLELIFNKMKDVSPLQYPSIVRELMPYVTTSLSTDEILQLASVVITKNPTMQTCGLPNEYIDHTGGYIGELWCYSYDLNTASDMIKKFIYDDIPFSEYNNPVEESQPTETN